MALITFHRFLLLRNNVVRTISSVEIKITILRTSLAEDRKNASRGHFTFFRTIYPDKLVSDKKEYPAERARSEITKFFFLKHTKLDLQITEN